MLLMTWSFYFILWSLQVNDLTTENLFFVINTWWQGNLTGTFNNLFLKTIIKNREGVKFDVLFTWQSQENMELTTSLETEQHMAKELAAKLSDMGVELEEFKQLVGSTTQY